MICIVAIFAQDFLVSLVMVFLWGVWEPLMLGGDSVTGSLPFLMLDELGPFL